MQRADMTIEDRRKALRYLMFLKEKRDGTIKVRGCADGRPQREYTRKEEVSSPTVSLEAMMLSCAIDAKEGRYIIVIDIPGTFLHADMEEEVHMILEGTVRKFPRWLFNCFYKITFYPHNFIQVILLILVPNSSFSTSS